MLIIFWNENQFKHSVDEAVLLFTRQLPPHLCEDWIFECVQSKIAFPWGLAFFSEKELKIEFSSHITEFSKYVVAFSNKTHTSNRIMDWLRWPHEHKCLTGFLYGLIWDACSSCSPILQTLCISTLRKEVHSLIDQLHGIHLSLHIGMF